MSKFSENPESKALFAAAAAAIVNSSLAEKAQRAAAPSESLQPGEVISLPAGCATVKEFTNSRGEVTKYLAFEGQATKDGKSRPFTISLTALTTPSWGSTAAIVDGEGKRDFNLLKLRFGHLEVSFEHVGDTVVPYINEDITLKPASQVKAFRPRYDNGKYVAKEATFCVIQ